MGLRRRNRLRPARYGDFVESSLGPVPLASIPLLERADDLIPLAGGLVQVLVGQLPPLLLHPALELLPDALDQMQINDLIFNIL